MLFVRNVVDNLDRLNFAYYKSFPTVSSSLITKNCDVRVRNKQCKHEN